MTAETTTTARPGDRIPDAPRAVLVLTLCAGVGAAVLAAAVAWRRRFARGPLEGAMHRVLR